MAGIKWLIAWWQSLPFPWTAWRIVQYVDAADEIPDQIPNRRVILVGSPGSTSWAAFDCPCRRKHRLMVNLDDSRRPTWSVTSIEPLTIHPSIDDISAGRHCHFFIRKGRIKWANFSWRVPT